MQTSKLLDQWFKRTSRRLAPSTTEQIHALTVGWKQSFGSKELMDITVSDIEDRENSRDDGRRSASALNKERVYLRQFFHYAKAHGEIDSDPTTTWSTRREVVRKRKVTLGRAEEERLCGELPDLACYIRLSVNTGQRQGTLRQLRWDHVGPSAIEIPADITKTRKPVRVPLTRAIHEALDLIPPVGRGLVLDSLPAAYRIHQAFKRATTKLGIDTALTPHCLRATFVARCAAAGVPLSVVMSVGGWSSQSTILKYYIADAPIEETTALLDRI